MEFVRKKVAEWERTGFITKLSSKPPRLNPLTVATKMNLESGEVKMRLCIDMRVQNVYADKTHLKFENLAVCQKTLCKNDYMFVFDLKNMYFHVRLQDKLSQYFCFRLVRANGTEEYYKYRVMGYGYSPAGRVATRLVGPIKAFLHTLGIRFTIFIDDRRICAASKIECDFKARTTLLVFQLAGWNIQWLKTASEPGQQVKYQEFNTNTVTMKYVMDQHKEEDVLRTIDLLLSVGQAPIPSRELASAVEKVPAARTSHGDIVVVMTRSTQHQLGQAVGCDGDWDSRDELRFLQRNFKTYNGTFIAVHKSADEVYEVAKNREMIELNSETDLPLDGLIVSDASDSKAFVYYDGRISFVCDFEFSESERSLAWGQSELRAVLLTLSTEKEKLRDIDKRILYWQTDSRNCHSFLRKGSKLRHIQNDVRQIKTLEHELGVGIVPVWTPRTHPRVVMADLGSKFHLSSDEWGIDRTDLKQILEAFNFEPTMDGFAKFWLKTISHAAGMSLGSMRMSHYNCKNKKKKRIVPTLNYWHWFLAVCCI